jgi:hypothetical protein
VQLTKSDNQLTNRTRAVAPRSNSKHKKWYIHACSSPRMSTINEELMEQTSSRIWCLKSHARVLASSDYMQTILQIDQEPTACGQFESFMEH